LAQKKGKKSNYKFEYLYSEALKEKLSKNYDKSISYFEECLKFSPESSASAYQLSILYLTLKQFDKAEYYIDYALKISPKNQWYLIQKSFVAGSLGDNTGYKNCYQLLNTYYPDNYAYAYELAILYYKDKQYDKALKLLNSVEETLGVFENISFLKNNIYFSTKQYKLIENELNKLINVFPDSVKFVDMLGEYFLSMQHINEAMSVYTEALNTFPDNKLINLKLAKVYATIQEYLKGYTFLLKGIGSDDIITEKQLTICQSFLSSKEITKEQKIKIYKALIDFYPEIKTVQNEYVSFLLNQKELTLAEKEILKILASDDSNFTIWNQLFSIYLLQNRVEDLNQKSTEALEFFPNQAIVYFYNGYSYFMLKQYAKASDKLTTGLDYVIDNKKLKLDFLLYLGESYHAQSLYKKSDKYFDMYLAIDSSNAYLLNNYAYYLSQREKSIDKAFKLSRKSIEIEPFSPSFLDTYAWIFYLKKDYKNALFNIEKAYKFGGKSNPVICEHYGDILLKSKKNTEALSKWKESLKLNPKNEALIDKINSLN
jgi:tetratricopeptide (TPR) repeat protein